MTFYNTVTIDTDVKIMIEMLNIYLFWCFLYIFKIQYQMYEEFFDLIWTDSIISL